MTFAAELLLDGATEATVREVWREFADQGISRVMHDLGTAPHLTLAVWDEIKDPLEQRIVSFAKSAPPVAVSFSHVGVFPSAVVFLGAVPTRELFDLHEGFLRCVNGTVGGLW